MLSLSDAINAAQSSRKLLTGTDGAVVTETADVNAKAALLKSAQTDLQSAIDADAAAKSGYKQSLSDLIDAANSEIAGL